MKGLLKSQRFDSILMVVDRLGKYVHFIPLSHPYSAKTIAEAFLIHIAKLHGFPKFIVSDRDKIFMSNFWGELFRLQGTNSMDKVRWQTAAWRFTCAASQDNKLNHGQSGFLG